MLPPIEREFQPYHAACDELSGSRRAQREGGRRGPHGQRKDAAFHGRVLMEGRCGLTAE